MSEAKTQSRDAPPKTWIPVTYDTPAKLVYDARTVVVRAKRIVRPILIRSDPEVVVKNGNIEMTAKRIIGRKNWIM